MNSDSTTSSIMRKQKRVVHFDLKGALPRLNYLEKVFSLISNWGASGVVLEYEDTFPYHGRLLQLQSQYAFSLEQISEIHSICKRESLEIIPLIQSFGHLEFVLKHDKFRHLREVDLYPNALCPFHPEALKLVQEIVEQVLDAHPQVEYLHIGADEVWHMGKCEKCQKEMGMRGWSLADLFLHWTSSFLRKIRTLYPCLKLVMWDDMMRNIPAQKLHEFSLGDLVEPMIWKYETSNFNFPPGMFDTYSQVFESIWIASSYKGATGSTQYLPPIQHHIDNQLTWLSLLNEHQYKFKEIRAIVLTGWQRYDHYAVLCELLPVSIPSLALCLKVIESDGFRQEDHEAVSRELGFQNKINVCPFPRPQILEQEMTFPGYKIHVGVQMWSNFVHKYQTICNSEGMLGWFSDYFRSKNFTNPAQVEPILFQLVELEEHLDDLEKHLESWLLEVYYMETVEEWIGCFIRPLQNRVKTIIKDCRAQIKVGGRTKNYGIKTV